MKRHEDLSAPRAVRRLGVQYDSEAFGKFSESIANFLGTGRFLVFQTAVIIVWISMNTLLPESWQFDPWSRGLVLLTLVLSVQASYAAPLILLAQNRQEQRDRDNTEVDRQVAERTQAETEFLAREIAGVRLSLADMATGETLHDVIERIDRLSEAVEQVSVRVDRLSGQLDER